MYFLMSCRFNKTKPEQFGLVYTDKNNIFLNPKDNSMWEKRELIDLGWGNEIGFYKLPHLKFDDLLPLVFSNKIKDSDYYGAVSVLLNDFPNEFLNKISNMIENKKLDRKKDFDLLQLIKEQMYLDLDIITRSKDNVSITYYKKWEEIFKQMGL